MSNLLDHLDPDKQYLIKVDGEIVAPEQIGFALDSVTLEPVFLFLQASHKDKQVTIEPIVWQDTEPPPSNDGWIEAQLTFAKENKNKRGQ